MNHNLDFAKPELGHIVMQKICVQKKLNHTK